MELEKIRGKAATICEQYREKKKLNQTRLAKKAGVSLKSVYNIEHKNPVYDETLQKVMSVCGYDYEIKIERTLKEKK